jgi:hypothetical protein
MFYTVIYNYKAFSLYICIFLDEPLYIHSIVGSSDFDFFVEIQCASIDFGLTLKS